MVNMIILELSILLHVISDFLLQTNDMVELRNDYSIYKSIFGNGIHSLIVFFITGLFLAPFVKLNSQYFVYCLLIAVFHFIIDFSKSRLIKRNTSKEVILFAVDQILHIVTIFILWYLFDLSLSYSWVNAFLNCSKTQLLRQYFHISINIRLLSNIIVFLIIYIYITRGADLFIDKLLSTFRYNRKFSANNYTDYIERAIMERVSDKNSILRSKYIGYIERTIVFFLVICNQIPSITLLLTAKSIARYPKLDKDGRFAEEFLVGTLTSIFIAIIGGVIFKRLLI